MSMEAGQLTLFTEYEANRGEREALIRGALFNAGFKPCDVTALALLCRAIWESDGSAFPPSVEDLVAKVGPSKPTVDRQLAVLRKIGIVQTVRDVGASARDPKRRTIDWEQTAKLARTALVAKVPAAAIAPGADASGSQGERAAAGSLAQGDTTRRPLTHGEATRFDFEATTAAVGSVCLDIYPPTPLRPKTAPVADAPGSLEKSGEGEELEVWKIAEAELRAAGVNQARQAIGEARRRRTSPELVRSLIAEFLRRPGLVPGLLYRRVCEAGPGLDPAKGWPVAAAETVDPIEAARRRTVEEEARRRRTLEADERRAAAEADRRRLEALEAEHGAAIDEADDGAIVAALRRTGRGSIVGAFEMRGRRSALVRGELLEAWASSTVAG